MRLWCKLFEGNEEGLKHVLENEDVNSKIDSQPALRIQQRLETMHLVVSSSQQGSGHGYKSGC